MSKRLQVLVDERELREIRRLAREEHVPVAEWVRRALRAAARGRSSTPPRKKLAAMHAATKHAFPSGSIEELLAQIERGYSAESTAGR